MWNNDHRLRAHRLHACSWILAAALGCIACDREPAPRRPPRPAVQAAPAAPAKPAAPAAANEAELKSVDAAGLFEYMRGQGKRGTVVNIWASWCGACKAEVPMLLKLREAFAPQNLDFVFVSADEPADLPDAVEQMRAWSGPLPVFGVPGPFTPFKRAMHPSWKGAIPATFLFDPTPKRRYFWEGAVLEHEISPILQGYLAGEPIDGEMRPPLAGQ